MTGWAVVTAVVLVGAVGCGGTEPESSADPPAWPSSTGPSSTDPVEEEALESGLTVLRRAARNGRASWRDVAYLADRVAVAKGEPQTYGTQVTCTQYGARVTTPLDEPEQIERLRAKAGLDPMHVYLAEMDRYCARQPPGG